MSVPIWAKRLTELRKAKDLTQEEVRAYLKSKGVDAAKGTYSRWESGTNEPTYYALNVLADYYGASTDWIFGREEYGQENKLRTERH